eukprot:5742563-Pleurochrysis_carterae.AAC.2
MHAIYARYADAFTSSPKVGRSLQKTPEKWSGARAETEHAGITAAHTSSLRSQLRSQGAEPPERRRPAGRGARVPARSPESLLRQEFL